MREDLTTLPARPAKGAFHVVVESPGGSRVKIKYDPKLRAFKFSRPLVTGLHYPFDWGFIPSTAAPDGDPLDAMVFSDLPTFPGVVIECRTGSDSPEAEPERGGGTRAQRSLDRRADQNAAVRVVSEAEHLPLRWRLELEEFFLAATRFENKNAEVLGWASAAEGDRMVDRCLAGASRCMGRGAK